MFNTSYQLDMEDQTLVSVTYGGIASIKLDGTVQAEFPQEILGWETWTNIRTLGINGNHLLVGVRTDNTVVAVGPSGQQSWVDALNTWTDISNIRVTNQMVVGLKLDGTLKHFGDPFALIFCENATNVKAVSLAWDFLVALHTDGTVSSIGQSSPSFINTSSLQNIVQVEISTSSISALDYTGVTYQANISDNLIRYTFQKRWNNIVKLFPIDIGNASILAKNAEGYLEWADQNPVRAVYNELENIKISKVIKSTSWGSHVLYLTEEGNFAEYSGNINLFRVVFSDSGVSEILVSNTGILTVLHRSGSDTVSSLVSAWEAIQITANISQELTPYVPTPEVVEPPITTLRYNKTILALQFGTVAILNDNTIYSFGAYTTSIQNELRAIPDVVSFQEGSMSTYTQCIDKDDNIVGNIVPTSSPATWSTKVAEKYWTNMSYVYSSSFYTLGVTKEGDLRIPNWHLALNVFSWKNLAKVIHLDGYNSSLVGLKRDGTLYFEGSAIATLTKIIAEGLTNIKDIAGGFDHLLILYNSGLVVGYGNNTSSQLNTSGWTNITKISAGYRTSLGLRADGTVVYTGVTTNSQHLVTGWTNITEISAGRYHVIGLQADGTLVGAGSTTYYQPNIPDVKLSGWEPIKKVSLQVDQAAYNLFDWDAPVGETPTEYEIQIATDVNYENIVEEATLSTNFYEAVTLEPSVSYHWRVRYR